MAGRDTGPGGPPAEQPGVPPSVLRSWDEAEARLFPLVMAQPELYQQALGAVQRLLGQLRETCRDLPALLAAHERGDDLLGGHEVPGVRPGLIAAAACATRYRPTRAAGARWRRTAMSRSRARSGAAGRESAEGRAGARRAPRPQSSAGTRLPERPGEWGYGWGRSCSGSLPDFVSTEASIW